jgi:hypothetical protein
MVRPAFASRVDRHPGDRAATDMSTSVSTSRRTREEPADAAGRPGQDTDWDHLDGPRREIYDIFEGTEQIQQLVIARAISGLRIE